MVVRDRLYIGGKWLPPSRPDRIEVIDPTSEQVTGSVPNATSQDAERAIAAARAAFEGWSATPARERVKYLGAVSQALTAKMAELGELITCEVGTPINLSMMIQVGLPVTTFASMAELVDNFAWEETIGHSLVVKEPVGVVGAITPWNYPLHQVAAKVAPALASGCTVVLKPSELAPLSAFVLAEVMEEAGLPEGVFNLVSGTGTEIGEVLAAHDEVDLVSFTGSLRTGRRVAELAAASVKRLTLELGGKSATVVLDDADLDRAVSTAVTMCLLNSGQTCIALSRLLVPRVLLGQVEEIASRCVATYTIGNPLEPTTRLGPLVSSAQREAVRGYIALGIDEGAKLVTGGLEAPEGLERGFFVRPTVFSEVRSDMAIAREEIFGPVLCILAYDTEQEAVAIANDSIYGLSGAVWSADVDRAVALARRIRTGQLDINGAMFNPLAPFGGFKQSGHGRELGKYGLAEYLETKSIQI
jgi:acyl-CoA reductase-like NAD-dependent aldehyde dehydrogenase